MPIKLPKTFARRKSSGGALEELDNSPEHQGSFKVFERPQRGNRSFDGPTTFQRVNAGRPVSTAGVEPEDNLFAGSRSPLDNRGSGGTNNSTSTGGLYDSSASSAQYSSTSTLPSSSDISISSEPKPFDRSLQTIPVPPIPESRPGFSVRAGGRTFSFGTRVSKVASPPLSSRPSTAHNGSPQVSVEGRERAFTASTASTATPPKLLDSDLEFGNSDLDTFGNMFQSLKQRGGASSYDHSSPLPQSNSPEPLSSSSPPFPQSKPTHKDRDLLPTPISIDRSAQIESSPYSWGSHDSREGLMSSPSPREQYAAIPRKSIPQTRPMPLSDITNSDNAGFSRPGAGIRRSSGYLGRRKSIPVDEDAKSVPDPLPHARRPFSNDRSPTSPSSRIPVALFDSDDPTIIATSATWREPSPEATPKPQKASTIPYDDVDASFVSHARLAAQYEEASPTKPTKKVMTPVQFERYRQQKELHRARSSAARSESSDESEPDEDEVEEERNRQAAKIRQKQEAHLSVYRQQMMKVTGEQPAILDTNMQPSHDRATLSATTLSTRFSMLGVTPTASGKSSGDEEEDEDVPLGILAAHGFPSKHRPPTRLSSSGSNPNLRGITPPQPYPAPPASATGEPIPQGAGGSLPVFARGLPKDPYFGAGLVNPTNREQLAMSGGASGRGGGSVYAGAPGAPHPAGLVGVIAGEERARAMRRGSPNAQGGYDAPPAPYPMHPGMARSQTMGNMSVPGISPMSTSGDQAQIQMSQQMSQMMHMQMQWMQQMQQMMAGQGGQGMAPGQFPQGAPSIPQMLGTSPSMSPSIGNGFLAPPGQALRPSSMPGLESPRQDQRTMSLLDPGKTPWNRTSPYTPSISGGPGYAPSMAPSERSNVGMASRYRPVSTMGVPQDKASQRNSTFTSGFSQNWALTPQAEKQGSAANSRPVHARENARAGSDDDDDEGWAEMQKRKEKKKSNWKMKRGESDFQDLFHAGM